MYCTKLNSTTAINYVHFSRLSYPHKTAKITNHSFLFIANYQHNISLHEISKFFCECAIAKCSGCSHFVTISNSMKQNNFEKPIAA